MLLLLACTASKPSDTTTEPIVVPWSQQRVPLSETSPKGRSWARGIIHLHSHYSHDACDGDPMPGGVPDEACLQDLRFGLCANAIDYAFITDHPAHAAYAPFEDLLLHRDGDTEIDGIANAINCGNGHSVVTMPGIEDELMPVGLKEHVSSDAAENDTIYNGTEASTLESEIQAGALVMQAHTEGKSYEDLDYRQNAGLTGVEIFNLHAMVDPDIRKENLGLEAFGYLTDLAPFMDVSNDIIPDMGFLAVFMEQAPSLERWDHLNQTRFTVATAGTDAHQNVLPTPLSDGERLDSYRRMIGWFSNVLLVDGHAPQDFQNALSAGRNYIVFEALGTPTGFDFAYGALEGGGEAALGETLTLACPTLSPNSPQDGHTPVITAQVYKDGVLWQEGCGTWSIAEAGIYRARVEIQPEHLREFLGSEADSLIHPYPWIYTNAFRIGL